jgi:hypothetical protein
MGAFSKHHKKYSFLPHFCSPATATSDSKNIGVHRYYGQFTEVGYEGGILGWDMSVGYERGISDFRRWASGETVLDTGMVC